MSTQVKLNDTIHLNLQLEDGNSGLFPSAVLRDKDGAEIIGSPVELTHIGNGLYQNDTILMPNTKEVTATYIIYEDAARTIVSPFYGSELDVFRLDENSALLAAIANDVTSILGGALPGDLVGIVDDTGDLEAQLEDESALAAELQDDGNLLGIIEEDELIAVLNEGEVLEGIVAC